MARIFFRASFGRAGAMIAQACARWCRHGLAVAALLALGAWPVPAAAAGSCEARNTRPAVAAGVVGTVVNVFVSPPGGSSPFEARSTRKGPGVAIDAEWPLGSRWALRGDFSVGRVSVQRVAIDPFGVRGRPEPDGHAGIQRLHAGIVRRLGEGRRLCGYLGTAAGRYRFEYLGQRSQAFGVAGLLGFDIPMSPALSAVFEIRPEAAATRSRPPVDAYTTFLLSASGGMRYRF